MLVFLTFFYSSDFTDYYCKLCHNMIGDLKKHELFHLGIGRTTTLESRFKCNLCDKSFSSDQYRNAHEQRVHGDKCHRCPYPNCDMACTTSASIRSHMRVHTNELRFKCQHCELAFKSTFSREKHMRSHDGKNFKCDLCWKVFIMQSQLQKHMKKEHSGNSKHPHNVPTDLFL